MMDVNETLAAKYVFSAGGDIKDEMVSIPVSKFSELVRLIETNLLETQEPIGIVTELGSVWNGLSPDMHKVGTKFYTKPAEKLSMRYMCIKRRHDRLIAIASEVLDKGIVSDHFNDLSRLIEESKN